MPYYPSDTDIRTLPGLQLQNEAIGTQPDTRDEIVAYYQEEYGDKWKDKLVNDLAPFTQGKNGQPQSRSSIQRRFQKRGEKEWSAIKPSKKQQEEYKNLGQTLNPIPPKNGVRVKGTIYVKYSDEIERRDINLVFQGEDAKNFTNKDANHISMILNKYQGITHDGSVYAGTTFGLQPADLGDWNIGIEEG